MRTLTVSVATVCALLAPIAASAAGTPSVSAVAASLCKQEQKTMGTTNFNAAYGTNADKSNAYGKCVSKNASAAQQDVNNAAKACKAEQADPNFATNHGGKTFDQFYGATQGPNAGANANGKCVSAKVKSAAALQASKAGSAARSCRADLKADKAAFATAWGTGTNAFGKCVSSKSKSK
jgi:hypothetical protein